VAWRGESQKLHEGNPGIRTLRLAVSAEAGAGQSADLAVAASILRGGGTVAFATETVYGLGANALDPSAVAKIFAAKQRPSWDPLIVHVADRTMLAQVVSSIPEAAQVLMDHFWPGPLTLLMPRHADLPDAVTAGRPRVGVRLPAHPVARALITLAGVPVAAPSANTFGHVSPTAAAHVADDLDGRIDAILDSGETAHGLESTVLDACTDPCLVYRPGAVTLEQLRAVWPATEAYIRADSTGEEPEPSAQVSPGLSVRHYAPRARLVLVEGDDLAGRLAQAVAAACESNERVGLMLPAGLALTVRAEGVRVYPWGSWDDPAELAHRLFAGLRALDDQGVQVIVCPSPKPEGLGVAILDRLRKAVRRN